MIFREIGRDRTERALNPSRRDMLLAIATATQAMAQDGIVQISGHPAEITLTPLSRLTVRISVQPLDSGIPVPIPATGALVEKGWPQPAARFRTLAATRSIKCGDLTVKLANSPLTISVEGQNSRPIQELRFDSGRLTFSLGDGPKF